MNKSAKEQLATGEIVACNTIKGHTKTRQITVPHWLFDLATHTDEFIFENFQALDGKKHIEKMSTALFTGLIISLRSTSKGKNIKKDRVENKKAILAWFKEHPTKQDRGRLLAEYDKIK